MSPEPAATYRVQLHAGFGFIRAAEIVPYLKALGISHFYASPYLQAAAGSMHGYDVVNPAMVNSELGGSFAHQGFCQALEKAGLGQILDIVPNHMAIIARENPWWWDVLENGPSSRYASYFDVDWEASEERWPNKVLLPFLADHYGRILEKGEIVLKQANGDFTLQYGDHVFPVDPSSLGGLLNEAARTAGSDYLGFIADSHIRLPRPTATHFDDVRRRHRDKAILKNLLSQLCTQDSAAAKAIDTEVARINADPDALDRLVTDQNYRLAFWRSADRDLGYRRFFDVNSLAGLRVEQEEVFRDTHALPLTWIREGLVQGLRIDHIDGLRDPAAYLQRLRESVPKAWIIAEKILEPGETLPPDWPIEGTTGYDFLAAVGGLFIDPEGEAPLTGFYTEFTGLGEDFREVVHASRVQVLTDLLGSELNRLASLFVDICEQHRRHRDYSRHELSESLLETAAGFPVYRTYVRPAGKAVSDADIRSIGEAVRNAAARRTDIDPELFRFLGDILILKVTGVKEAELAVRFQQLTSPAMAKGVEDTAFYRYNRLVCLNEVGGDPELFGISVDDFHGACTEVFSRHPFGLAASSTHDSKRSEDVRARIALLSEIPDEWSNAVRRWGDRNQRHRTNGMPDRNIEYLFYQTLAGAWPIDTGRISAFMEKAAREAKVHTTWNNPNGEYELNLRTFVFRVMDDHEFQTDFERFVIPLVTPGRINSLSQTLIKLTAPGIPDIYQGTELWDLNLVDPDNRRPVDYALRAELLSFLEHATPEEVLARADDGAPKLWVIQRVLRFRQKNPALFGPRADYRPVIALGGKAGHLVAFLRGEAALTLAPRLIRRLNGDWGTTSIVLPKGRWLNILSDDAFEGGETGLGDIFRRFPVAFLVREEYR